METKKKKKKDILIRKRRKPQNVGGEKHFKLDKQLIKEESQFPTTNEENDLPPGDVRCCITSGTGWKCKNLRILVDGSSGNLPNTKYCLQHYTYYCVDRREKNKKKREKKKRKRKKKKRMKEEETGIQSPDISTSDASDFDTRTEGGSANIGTKRKYVKRTKISGEPKSLTQSREPVVELECLEYYKSKCSDLSVELDKKKEECTILQGKLVEVETRKPTATDETEQTPADATDCWRKMFSDLESRVLRLENENSRVGGCVESHFSKLESLDQRMEDEELAMVGCLESRISNLESLVLRRGKESSILRCAPLRDSEKIGSEARGLQNDVTQSGESLGTEDSDNSVDPKSSLGDLMHMLTMNKWNRDKNEEIKWKSEADMLSSFEVDPELCMKAVCALHRQKISEDEISAKSFLHYRDVVRVTTLAEYLMDGECKGDLKKSVDELEIFDSEAVEDCKMLAVSYSEQLFSIYENREDPYFLPNITDSHGDQTAK